MQKAWDLSYPLSAQRRLCSDWAVAQADLSLRWAHTHFVGIVMSRLKLYSTLQSFRNCNTLTTSMAVVTAALMLSGIIYWANGACYFNYQIPQRGVPHIYLFIFIYTD